MTVWEVDAKKTSYSALNSDISADVVIIGGGITGLTSAFLLNQSGKSVVVLEGNVLSNSGTAKSSAQLTVQSDYSFNKTYSSYNSQTVKLVAESRLKAIELIGSISENFSCDFKRVSSFYYTENDSKIIEEEYKYALMAGLDVQLSDNLPLLPFPVKKALEFKQDAVFNPVKYLYGLAEHLTKNGNCKIFENSRVIEITENKTIKTKQGSVKAKDIVFATHYPIFFNIHQTLAYPFRSYIIAAKVNEYPSDNSFWDTADPYFYIRTYSAGDQRWVLIGGADHKTGHTQSDAYSKLERFLQTHFSPVSIDFRWSNQYYEPADGLPFIGKSLSGNEYIATGYSGVGLVYGTVAAMIISDEITGNKNRWSEVFKARRINFEPGIGKFFKENIGVAEHYIKDLFLSEDLKAENLIKGEGKIIKKDGKHYAVVKNDNDEIIALSAACTHLKCLVHWNSLEKTWDCPCHGSRFTTEGKVILGPAVKDLSVVYRKQFETI